MRRILVVLVMCFGSVSLFAQSPSAEQQIRDLIARYDTGQISLAATQLEKDAVVWSGAYSKPQIAAANPAERIAAPGRKNRVLKTDVQRIVVAKAGDMAYEYSTFALSFDDDAGHKDLKGAILRVWRQSGTGWKIAAVFQRPYGRVVPVDAPAK